MVLCREGYYLRMLLGVLYLYIVFCDCFFLHKLKGKIDSLSDLYYLGYPDIINCLPFVLVIVVGKKDYRGIGLVEVMWKVVSAILNRRFTASITNHDFLHMLRAGRGTGTATLEAKLLQHIAALREEVLYMIFLDLHKAYNALDRSRCLEILEGYGVGPRAREILRNYWHHLTMVARAGD